MAPYLGHMLRSDTHFSLSTSRFVLPSPPLCWALPHPSVTRSLGPLHASHTNLLNLFALPRQMASDLPIDPSNNTHNLVNPSPRSTRCTASSTNPKQPHVCVCVCVGDNVIHDPVMFLALVTCAMCPVLSL